jgi:hypothetical protein
MNMAEQFEGNWNLKDLLSDLIGATAPAAPTPRAEIWASDIGKPYVDRWLQMKGTPYSNPPNGADLLTFYLGKQIETGLAQMLTRCGIAFRSQEKLRIQPEGCLPVVGRPDLVAEVTDWQKVKDAAANRLPDDGYVSAAQRQALGRLLADWQERCPDGLPLMVFEIKSVNSQAFRYHQGNGGFGDAYPHHRLQLYTYIRGLNLAEGHLLYVARDTGWMEEVVVRPTEELEADWLADVLTISRYIQEDTRPPLEPLYLDGKANWRVSYSRYKDYLYNPESAEKEVSHGAFSI